MPKLVSISSISMCYDVSYYEYYCKLLDEIPQDSLKYPNDPFSYEELRKKSKVHNT